MTARPERPDLLAVQVVVPAHDEEAHIGACLASVGAAVEALRRHRPDLVVGVTLVLDRCVDATAAVAAAAGVPILAVDAGCVGAARAAGVALVAAQLAELDPARVLIVNTDADCVVPPSWLVDLTDLAAAHDLVQGEVSPEPTDMSAESLAAWWADNPAGRGSLHGANLAFRLAAYAAAGGFPPVSDREDALLVRAMKANGVAATGGTRVLTSGRREGRVPGGFSAYLRALDLDLGGASPGS